MLGHAEKQKHLLVWLHVLIKFFHKHNYVKVDLQFKTILTKHKQFNPKVNILDMSLQITVI